jgi:hypothetical protein
VWATVRDFTNHPQWHPKFSRSHIEAGFAVGWEDNVGSITRSDPAS